MKTIGILPVKQLDSAYSRLAGILDAAQRKRLAEATFVDALGKIRQCKTLHETLVVTADHSVARHARWLGHLVVTESEVRGTPVRLPLAPALGSSGARIASPCSQRTARCSIQPRSTITSAAHRVRR